MSFLIIGTGAIGQRHAANLSALGESSTALSFRENGAQGVANAVKTTQFEAAFLCTASQIRLPIIEILANANLPIYIEKPIAYTAKDLTAIHAVLGDLANTCFAGFMMRYHPAVQALAQMDLSDIYRFTLTIGHDVHQWRKDWSIKNSYAGQPDGGGVLLDLCHEIDIITLLLPDLRLSSVRCLDAPDFAKTDVSTEIALHSQTAQGVVAMDYLSPQSTRRLQMWGRDQTIDFDFINGEFIHNGARADYTLDRQKMFQTAIADFIAVSRGQNQQNRLAPSLPDCHNSNMMICTAYQNRDFIGTIAAPLCKGDAL